ncbi:MAG: hypothetical protein IKE68_07265, partial [Solobacterium sp.]|nr:hypothetical protein [Solobacterium sp.]
AAKDEDEKELNIPDFKLTDEQKEKIEEIKETAETSFNGIKEKAANAINDNPEIAKTIEFLRANAIKAIDVARDKIEDLRSDPGVQRNLSDAGEKAKKVGAEARKAVDNVLTDEKKEALQQNFNKASESVKEGAKAVKESVNEFMSRPEVAETLDKARENVRELADKGTEAIKNLLKKDQ